MKDRYLEITFRKGRPLAAYLYLPGHGRAKSVQTKRIGAGLNADYDRDGNLLGLEVTAPHEVSVEQINDVLRTAGLDLATPEELKPLRAA